MGVRPPCEPGLALDRIEQRRSERFVKSLIIAGLGIDPGFGDVGPYPFERPHRQHSMYAVDDVRAADAAPHLRGDGKPRRSVAALSESLREP